MCSRPALTRWYFTLFLWIDEWVLYSQYRSILEKIHIKIKLYYFINIFIINLLIFSLMAHLLSPDHVRFRESYPELGIYESVWLYLDSIQEIPEEQELAISMDQVDKYTKAISLFKILLEHFLIRRHLHRHINTVRNNTDGNLSESSQRRIWLNAQIINLSTIL